MLVFTRCAGQVIVIDGPAEVTVLRIRGKKVRLGVEAARTVGVDRKEVRDRKVSGLEPRPKPNKG